MDAGVPPEQWRKVHPFSLVFNAWSAIAALIAFVTYKNSEVLQDIMESSAIREGNISRLIIIVAVTLLGILFLIILVSWLSWRATSWAITDTAVWFRSGILMRSQRHARLDRIQAVDITHPLLGRIFDLGRLNIEVAGGANSNLTFGFLRTHELEEARAEILARAAGVLLPSQKNATPDQHSQQEQGTLADNGVALQETRSIPARSPQMTTPALEAPERELYALSPKTLMMSLLCSGVFIVGILMILAGFIAVGILIYAYGWAGLSSIFSIIVPFSAVATYLWSRFAGEFNFRAAVSPDGIRVRSGLTETRAQTIPPRRVHTVRISQPLLWRFLGLYRVNSSQAGYGGGDSQNHTGDPTVLLPAGNRQDAELALWLIIRDLGVNDPQAFLEEAFNGQREGHYFTAIPECVKRLDPFSYKRRAFALTDSMFVIRDGWLNREITFLPIERLQSITVEHGPWLRSLGIVNVHVHTVQGIAQAHAYHVDREIAATIIPELTERARKRRASEPPEKWMLRVAVSPFHTEMENTQDPTCATPAGGPDVTGQATQSQQDEQGGAPAVSAPSGS
ncbi:PH domain-containing protein [Schaalia sp. lx-260]|uniref:PH domain-containing protein n=1 Tax=Schaalia sp. lx-260 TaxID=2899082 RepID=UPI001E29421A|nr:PH domain-containing protein [Schaalia sp. lx-260]